MTDTLSAPTPEELINVHRALEQEIPALVKCEDRGVRNKAIVLIGFMPSGLTELLVLACTLQRDCVHFAVQGKDWPPGEWDNTILRDNDEAIHMKKLETFLERDEKRRKEKEREEREYQKWCDYCANEDNRLYGEKLAAVRDQHCRIAQLKEQHRRSLQGKYHCTAPRKVENRQCQQPRGSQKSYARRNVMQFNNANVYKPKQKQRKTQ